MSGDIRIRKFLIASHFFDNNTVSIYILKDNIRLNRIA